MKTKVAHKPKKKRCPQCGELKPKKQVFEAPDPFQSEINDDNTPVLMCNDCRYGSSMDV